MGGRGDTSKILANTGTKHSDVFVRKDIRIDGRYFPEAAMVKGDFGIYEDRNQFGSTLKIVHVPSGLPMMSARIDDLIRAERMVDELNEHSAFFLEYGNAITARKISEQQLDRASEIVRNIEKRTG